MNRTTFPSEIHGGLRKNHYLCRDINNLNQFFAYVYSLYEMWKTTPRELALVDL